MGFKLVGLQAVQWFDPFSKVLQNLTSSFANLHFESNGCFSAISTTINTWKIPERIDKVQKLEEMHAFASV